MQSAMWRLNAIRMLALLQGFFLAGCVQTPVPEVVVYTSLDQTFSEPILRDFEQQTGVRVRAVYDTEATKTTGLVNRLLAEKAHPQADVFWNSEVIRTIVLKSKGVLAPYDSPAARTIPAEFKDLEGYWTGFAARSRVLIANTASVSEGELPTSIFELADDKWRGAVGLAYPLFGTTATHAAALFAELGPDEAQSYFRRLKDNGVVIVDGNATAKDRVASGQLKVAFTDTDDANLAVQAGAPVKMIFPDRDGVGTLVIPNTVALVANGPHPDRGRQLIDYLLSEEVERRLSSSGSLQMPVRQAVEVPADVPKIQEIRSMQVDWERVAENVEPSAAFLQQLFVR